MKSLFIFSYCDIKNIEHLRKVRLASPFPIIGINNIFPAIEYLPIIINFSAVPNTSNFDVFGS